MSPVMIPTFVFDALAFAGTVLIIAGVIALVVGLFGARGFHDVGLKARPQCARCSYDLRSTMSPAGTCPECGADLSTPDAVVVAQRRVRWKLVVLGIVLLACAGLAAWKLDAKGRTALRSALAEMSSTRANLDALVTDGDAAPFAREALRARTGSVASGTPRTIPPDALLDPLLDALMEASDRHEADANVADPLNLLSRADKARFVAEAIDDLELQRLERLAVEELLGSNGQKRRLLRIASLAKDEVRREQSRDRMKALLVATPEGRALLDWRPESPGTEAWSLGTVSLSSLMGDPRSGDEARREGELALIVEQVRLEPIGGGAAVVVPVAWLPENRNKRPSPLSVSFLADVPPGKYRLSFEGALVRNANVPRIAAGRARGIETGMPRGDFNVAAALMTEGARALDLALEVEVVEPKIVPMPFSNDATKVGTVAKLLEYARFMRNDEGSIVLDEEALTKVAPQFLVSSLRPQTETDAFLSMLFELRQRGRTMSLSAVHMDGDSLAKTEISVDPKTIDPRQPFELLVTPTTMWKGAFNGGDAQRSSMIRGDAAWADYTLRFTDMDAAAQVETTAKPLAASIGTPRTDAEARSAVERWARALRILEPRRRSDGQIVLRSSRRARDIAALPAAGTNDEQTPPPLACDWPKDLVLSGWVEVRRDGQLIAERLRVAGPVDEWTPLAVIESMAGGPESRMDVARSAPWTASPLVLRYLPDARIGASDGSGPFAFVALPFELRELPSRDGDAATATAIRGSAPDSNSSEARHVFELVWLEAAPAANGAPDAGVDRSK
jgi:hypothetical protein